MFKRVGDKFRGFIDFAEENSSVINCLEVTIKVKGNYCGFISVEFDLIDGFNSFLVQVASFQDPNLLIDKVVGIHGSFLPKQAEKFFQGLCGSDSNSVDIWHVERSNSRMSVYVT